jgi:uncharacterized phage protein (TIGR02218 family)
MTYAIIESSTHDGDAVFLFEFVQAATTWRYTSRGEEVTALSQSWAPAPIQMSDISQTNEINKNAVSLTFPRDHAFAAQFLGFAVEQVTTVTIRRGHADDGEYVVYWKGRVSASDASAGTIKLDCESIFTSMRRMGLRARYQIPCRHALYQRGCDIDKSAHAWSSAASVVGTLVAASGAAGKPDGWFTGGMIVAPDGAARFIIAHTGASLTLLRTFDSLQALTSTAGYGRNYGNYYGGVPVTLYPGCDHAKATCADKFANLPNYGGFPYIPSRNPLDGRSIV